MIPKIAHWIWLNGSLPRWVERNIKSFHDCNPDWQTCVWHRPPLEMPNSLRQLMDELPFLASKSDIFRYWLLSEYGGVYLDCDNYVLRSFEPLLRHSFFTAPCMPWPHTYPHIACGLMGSKPNSPASRAILSQVRTVQDLCPERRDRKDFGPDLLTPLFMGFQAGIRVWAHGATLLPEHYFYWLRTRATTANFLERAPAGQALLLETCKADFLDGEYPYSIHQWGVEESSTRKADPDAPRYYTVSLSGALAGPLSWLDSEPVADKLDLSPGERLLDRSFDGCGLSSHPGRSPVPDQ